MLIYVWKKDGDTYLKTAVGVLQVHVFVSDLVFYTQVIRVLIKSEVKNAATLNIAYVVYHAGRYTEYIHLIFMVLYFKRKNETHLPFTPDNRFML